MTPAELAACDRVSAGVREAQIAVHRTRIEIFDTHQVPDPAECLLAEWDREMEAEFMEITVRYDEDPP